MTISIPIIPRDYSTELTVDMAFNTSVSESESGFSGRKSLRDIALRRYNLTVNPDNAAEVQRIILACRGARWPAAIRDFAGNYELSNDHAIWDATLSKFKIYTQ